MKQILEGLSTKDLAWQYKSLMSDCLPEQAKAGTELGFNAVHYLESIASQQKELDFLNNIPLEELLEKEIADYYKWMERVEATLSEEKKIMREKCNNTIAELKNWHPEAECSKQLKIKLIELIKNNIEYALYDWTGHPEVFTPEFAERQILIRKEDLTQGIVNAKRNYLSALEYEKEISLLEIQLQHDLELMK